jgi:hypothetical protein
MRHGLIQYETVNKDVDMAGVNDIASALTIGNSARVSSARWAYRLDMQSVTCGCGSADFPERSDGCTLTILIAIEVGIPKL